LASIQNRILAKTLFLEGILKSRAAEYYGGVKQVIYINIIIKDKIKIKTRGLP